MCMVSRRKEGFQGFQNIVEGCSVCFACILWTSNSFNMTKDVVVLNMKESIHSQRLVYDYIKDIERLASAEIPRDLMISCKGARQRYEKYLEEQKVESTHTEASQKRQLKTDEILEVKRT